MRREAALIVFLAAAVMALSIPESRTDTAPPDPADGVRQATEAGDSTPAWVPSSSPGTSGNWGGDWGPVMSINPDGLGTPEMRDRHRAQLRASRPRESMALAHLGRMTGGLDDPMGRILSQMPDGMIPDRRQYGERREFKYTFADRSQVS
ncbi:MAG: hypothetical protein OXF93_15600 [Acidobacteria bacterium]|nr:hypothetical protein [Acidobacteriota bacterium]